MLFDIFKEGFDERSADICDPSLEPHVIVKEVALARQNSEVHSKIVVFTVHYGHERFLHFLSNVEHPGQIHDALVMAAEFAHRADHEGLVILPQCLKD